jgi:dodecin
MVRTKVGRGLISKVSYPNRGNWPAAKEVCMPDNVYKVIELVGTSEESWEKAAKAAVERAAQTLRDLRVAEVVEQDLVIEKGKVAAYRTKMKVSFKYEGKD